MMDDSKHTEDHDMSRSEYTEIHAQETLRNLQRDMHDDSLQLKINVSATKANVYENLREDEDSHREYLH